MIHRLKNVPGLEKAKSLSSIRIRLTRFIPAWDNVKSGSAVRGLRQVLPTREKGTYYLSIIQWSIRSAQSPSEKRGVMPEQQLLKPSANGKFWHVHKKVMGRTCTPQVTRLLPIERHHWKSAAAMPHL